MPPEYIEAFTHRERLLFLLRNVLFMAQRFGLYTNDGAVIKGYIYKGKSYVTWARDREDYERWLI